MKFKTEDEPWNRQEQSIELRVPPLGGTILRYVGPLPKKRTRKTAAKSAKPAAKSATAGKAAAKKAPSRKTAAAKTGNTKVAGKSKAPSSPASKGGNAKARSTGATKSE